jgi:hypothetical protein
MRIFVGFLVLCFANFEVYQESFQLVQSSADHKFEVHKEVNSESCLVVMKIGSVPYFEYDKNEDSWNISATFFDSVSWIRGSEVSKVEIPGTISGRAYLGLYSTKDIPYFKVENSEKSKTSCLFPCKNQGVCQKGKCHCKDNYGGTDCSIYFVELESDKKEEFSISSLKWKFFQISSNSDLYLKFKSKSEKSLRLYIEKKHNSALPTMLDSKEFTTSSSLSKTFTDSSNDLRFSLYCMKSSGSCSGSLKISSISYESYLWVIIFSVIVGIFFVGAVPLVLIYCKKHGKGQIKAIQITKEQLEKMFPCEDWDGETTEVCSICLDELKSKICRVLSCGHPFHAECIDEWAESNLDCPVCKQNIIEEYFEKKHKDKGKEVLLTENV